MVLFPPLLELFFTTFVNRNGKVIFSDQIFWEQFSASPDKAQQIQQLHLEVI